MSASQIQKIQINKQTNKKDVAYCEYLMPTSWGFSRRVEYEPIVVWFVFEHICVQSEVLYIHSLLQF